MDPWGGQPPPPEARSPAYLADRVGVTPGTVRQRIQALEADGVIQAYQAYPEPGQLGLDITALQVRAPDGSARSELIDELVLSDGVLEVHDLHGPWLLVVLAHRDPAERTRRTRLLSRRTADPDPLVLAARTGRRDQRNLTHLDWRIVQALRGQADRSPSHLADEVGVSYRTVRRHLDRMLEEGSLTIAPQVDTARMEGVMPVDLVVVLEAPGHAEAIEALGAVAPDRVLQRYLPPPGGEDRFASLFSCLTSTGEMTALRQEIQGLTGVRHANAVLPLASHTTGWLDEQIAAQVAATAP